MQNKKSANLICTLILGQTKNEGFIMKYSNEFKQQCIEMYYRGEYPETPEGKKLEDFHHLIRRWARKSERSSLDSVMNKTHHKQRTAEEKLELVQQVLAGKSCTAVAEENGIEDSVLYQWVRKYRMEGYEGLVNKPQGRKPKEPVYMPKKKEEPRELTESEREELLRLRAENEYLRAEAAAIKKLMALRREKEAARLEAKKQQRSKRSEKKDTD